MDDYIQKEPEEMELPKAALDIIKNLQLAVDRLSMQSVAAERLIKGAEDLAAMRLKSLDVTNDYLMDARRELDTLQDENVWMRSSFGSIRTQVNLLKILDKSGKFKDITDHLFLEIDVALNREKYFRFEESLCHQQEGETAQQERNKLDQHLEQIYNICQEETSGEGSYAIMKYIDAIWAGDKSDGK